jgi:hypothetical protein
LSNAVWFWKCIVKILLEAEKCYGVFHFIPLGELGDELLAGSVNSINDDSGRLGKV